MLCSTFSRHVSVSCLGVLIFVVSLLCILCCLIVISQLDLLVLSRSHSGFPLAVLLLLFISDMLQHTRFVSVRLFSTNRLQDNNCVLLRGA